MIATLSSGVCLEVQQGEIWLDACSCAVRAGRESLSRQRYPFVALRRAALALQDVLMPDWLSHEMVVWREAVAAKACLHVPQGLDA